MTGRFVTPNVVQAGDHVLDNKHDVLVTHIEGPDFHGIYDFHGVNELGKAQIVSAQEFVQLLQ